MINRFDEGLDVALLAEDERTRVQPNGSRRLGYVGINVADDGRRGQQGGVDGDAGGIVATVLEAAEAMEEDLEDVTPLPVDVVIQVREYPTHCSVVYSSSSSSSSRLCFSDEDRCQ